MRKKFLSIQLPESVKGYLEKQAQEFDVSVSVVVRDMIKEQIGLEKWNILKSQDRIEKPLKEYEI